MIMSASITDLVTAMQTARREFKKIPMNGFNPHFRSHYAKLEDVMAATDSALDNNNLVIAQFPSSSGPAVGVFTLIAHTLSGQFIGHEFSLPLSRSDAQTGTAAVTYARRTALCAALQVVGDPDDDGNNANPGEQPKQAKPAAAKKAAPVETKKPGAGATSVPKAEIPNTVTTDEIKVADPNAVPTQETFNKFRDAALKIGNKFKTTDGGTTVPQFNRKIRALICKSASVDDPTKLTFGQWNAFFQLVEGKENNVLVAMLNETGEKTNE